MRPLLSPRLGLRAAGFGSVAAALCSLAACGALVDEPRWWDRLQADSPCYRVDVLDGLDESSTAEVDDLFACVNHHGHIEPLMPVVDALHWDSRTGDEAAIELARAVNAMTRVDVDPFAIAGVLAGALRADDRPIEEIVDLWLELVYGAPAADVRDGLVPLTSAPHLEGGVLVPLAPVVPLTATALLDDESGTAAWVGGWIASPETRRWVRTLESWVTSDLPRVSEPVDGLVRHLGQMALATRTPGNDEWPAASGDSLRDLLEVAWLGPDPAIAHVADDAATLLADPGLRGSLEPSLVALYDAGHLDEVAPQVVWMTRVTPQGAPRSPGDDSALEAFVRLLASSNQPMTCEVDLWLTTVEAYSTPNLAVRVLSLLADLEPGTVGTILDVTSWLTGNTVTDWVLRQAVNSGLCSGISTQQLEDLASVGTMTRPEAHDLLVVFVRVLEILKKDATTGASDGHLPVLADLVERLYDSGGYPALEELVRDVGEQQVLVDLVDLVPVLADPAAFGIRAGDEPAAGLQDALGLLEWVVKPDPDGVAGWARLRPLVAPVLRHDQTWTALDHATRLMVDERTQTSRALDILPPLLAADPELALLDQLGPLLQDEALSQAFLRLIETPQVSAALLATEPQGDQQEVPLAFVSRLAAGDTLADLMALVDTLFGR